jgi:hypothetical protein
MPEDFVDPIREALASLLTDDATLTERAPNGIHHLRAPQGTEVPYGIFNEQSGLPIRSFGDKSKNQLWLVKGVCRGGDQGEAEAIDARCEELLDRQTFAIAGFDLLGCERETDVIYPEDDQGETIYHVGALYRIQTYPNP